MQNSRLNDFQNKLSILVFALLILGNGIFSLLYANAATNCTLPIDLAVGKSVISSLGTAASWKILIQAGTWTSKQLSGFAIFEIEVLVTAISAVFLGIRRIHQLHNYPASARADILENFQRGGTEQWTSLGLTLRFFLAITCATMAVAAWEYITLRKDICRFDINFVNQVIDTSFLMLTALLSANAYNLLYALVVTPRKTLEGK